MAKKSNKTSKKASEYSEENDPILQNMMKDLKVRILLEADAMKRLGSRYISIPLITRLEDLLSIEEEAVSKFIKSRGKTSSFAELKKATTPKTQALRLVKKLSLNDRLKAKYGKDYNPALVRARQRELIAAGYDLGKFGADGDWGPLSRAKWEEYQKKKAEEADTRKRLDLTFNLGKRTVPFYLVREKNSLKNSLKILDNLAELISKIFPGKAIDRNGQNTEECAAYINGILSKGTFNGAWGNSYNTIKGNNYPFIANGYTGMELPGELNQSSIHNFNKKAADNFKQLFNILNLDKTHLYPVNMFYQNSRGVPSGHTIEYFREAKKGNTETYGTHTGVVYYSPKHNLWRVNHNIHGKIQDYPLEENLGSRTKYGVGITAMGDAGKIGRIWYNPFTW